MLFTRASASLRGNTALGVVTLGDIWTASYSSDGDIEPTQRSYTLSAPPPVVTKPPDDFNPQIDAIHGSTESNVWIVGDRGLLMHYDGQQLTSPISSSPGANYLGGITSMWDDGCGQVWATSIVYHHDLDYGRALWRRAPIGWIQETAEVRDGYGDTAGPQVVNGAPGTEPWTCGPQGYLAHRVNGTWKVLNSGTQEYFENLWSAGAETVWAAGQNSVVFWDGSQAKTFAIPMTNGLRRLTGSSNSDVWTIAYEGLLHYDGKVWSPVATPPGSNLWSIWTNTPGELWAIDITGTGASTLWHFASGTWSVALNPNDGTVLQVISGLSPSDVWAAGTINGQHYPNSTSQLFHFDGRRWSSMPSSLPDIGALQPLPNGQLWINNVLLLQP